MLPKCKSKTYKYSLKLISKIYTMLVIAADMGKENKSLSNEEIKEISMKVVVSVGVVSKIHQQISDLHAKNRTGRKRILIQAQKRQNPV